MKKYLYLKYGLNFSRSNILLNLYGFSNLTSKVIKNNIFFEDFDFFLIKNLDNYDFILKKIYDSILKKIENGSYKGYKFSRNLPIYNQRTKTNAKTSRRIKNNV